LSPNEQLHLLLSQKIEPSEVFDISGIAIQTLIDETCLKFQMLKPMNVIVLAKVGGIDPRAMNPTSIVINKTTLAIRYQMPAFRIGESACQPRSET
jgi:hypothetical protein